MASSYRITQAQRDSAVRFRKSCPNFYGGEKPAVREIRLHRTSGRERRHRDRGDQVYPPRDATELGVDRD